MNKPILVTLLMLAAWPAWAEPAQTVTATQVEALVTGAKAAPPKPAVSQTLMALAPYQVSLDYRKGDAAPAGVHETEAELIFVLDGAGTLIEGGTLTDAKRVNASNLSGPSIAGGTSHPLAKGDFAFIPQNTPHQMIPAKGGALVLVGLHVPRTSDDRTGAKTFATAAEISALADKAKSELKPGAAISSETIVNLAPYRVALEYRAGGHVAGPSVHQSMAELMYGYSGAGTVTTNGTMVDPKPSTPGNLTGSGITGGTVHDVAAGDFLFVPENTPHQIIAANGGDFVLVTLHVPRPVPK